MKMFGALHLMTACLLTLASPLLAQAIATCTSPSGYSYNHHQGFIDEENSGWIEDAISGGVVTLQKLADGTYDILFLDATKQIFSSRQDGGHILLMRNGINDATFLHFNPGMVIELYTFWKSSDGDFFYDLIQSKGGDGMLFHKSALMIGTCGAIDFSLIE